MRVNDSTPEDGEPTSFAEKTKHLYEKHGGKIRAGVALGGMALAVAVVIARQAVDQNSTDDAEDSEDTGDTGDTGSIADPAAVDERRKSPVKHQVAGYTKTLADGRAVDVPSYERGGSPDEDPGEDAA